MANYDQEDVRRQALNVFRMKLLGAEVISVETGDYSPGKSLNFKDLGH